MRSKEFIKYLAAAMAIAMLLLSVVSCTGNDTDEGDTETVEADTSAGSINGVPLDKFVIVYEDNEATLKRANTLKNAIKDSTGYDLTLVANTEGAAEAEYEIILGRVDRNIEALKEFYANDYKYYNAYKIAVSGKKLAILASHDITLGLAVKYLNEKYFSEGAEPARISDADSILGDIYDNKTVAINRRITDTDIRIAANNIYFHQKDKESEKDDYEYRKPFLLQNFVLFDADVLMLQECGYDKTISPTKNTWHDVIDHELVDLGYTYVPADPSHKLLVNYTPIWYRADKLELVDCKFQLFTSVNEMPDGSLSHSKSYTRAIFKDKNSGEQFACISTHFTYAGDPKVANNLRKQDATEIVTEVKELREKYSNELPIILMGDLNCAKGSDPYKILDAELDNVLTTEGIVRKNALYGTTHSLGALPKQGGGIIDHTLISGSGYKAVQYHHVINDWSSHSTDHIPLIVDIDFSAE